MMIEFSTGSYHFHKRLAWHLASFNAMRRPDGVGAVHSLLAGDEASLEVWRKYGGPASTASLVGRDGVEKRWKARRNTLECSPADWVVFCDCDMVYAPDFLEKLWPALVAADGDGRVYGLPRYSSKKAADALVDAPPPANPWRAACKAQAPLYCTGTRPIGYCQILQPKAVRARGLKYPEAGDRFSNGRVFMSSDVLVRKEFGSCMLFSLPGFEGLASPLQLHLQHDRDYSKEH
jgi:hypothetical protein